ncbi:uncharacterized protein LOC120253221 [Dioscorea cayenensis subsp. rotundata]|uniref:Uncharacterized protein LOC120253221 n=1 Tax=Dioscorea cayennensis subsp. rotundata TaxID=55577 RepID=A0AB40AT93_DIOCR|nr:uncharacterized protein LOC120253221 [Dioscorea cayenensis subsp. rotundata]
MYLSLEEEEEEDVIHIYKDFFQVLRLVLRGLDFLDPLDLRKTPQNPQAETLGEGGSKVGSTPMVRNPRPPPFDKLRSIIPVDPTLRDCLSSGPSLFLSLPPLPWFRLPENLSSHTNPDDPDLLNVSVDLCRPAILET